MTWMPDNLFKHHVIPLKNRLMTLARGFRKVKPLPSVSHLEGAHERLVHAHHGTGVVKLSAVVGSREQSDELPLCEKLITIFHHLKTDDIVFSKRGSVKVIVSTAPVWRSRQERLTRL